MAGLADTLKKKREVPAKPALKTKRSKPVNGTQANVAVGMAAMLAKKRTGKLGGKGLAGLRAKKDAIKAASSKLDFNHNGLRYHNVRVIGEDARGNPIGSVDVSNNDITITFNNNSRVWLHDVPDKPGFKKEPRSAEIAGLIIERWDRELKDRGILTLAQKRKKQEEEEAAARKKKRKPVEEAKPTLKTKRKKKE